MADDGTDPGQGAAAAQYSPQFTPIPTPKHFHLHLVSDASGETLTTMAKAAVVQIAGAKPNRHMHPLVRNPKQLAIVMQHIEANQGIVLYTLMNPHLAELLEERCAELSVPCVAVLKPVLQAFEVSSDTCPGRCRGPAYAATPNVSGGWKR